MVSLRVAVLFLSIADLACATCSAETCASQQDADTAALLQNAAFVRQGRALLTKRAERADEQCKPWCTKKEPKSWSQRCKKPKCSGCAACEAVNEAPASTVCKPWCTKTEPKSWSQRCKKPKCSGCTACEAVTEAPAPTVCKPWCSNGKKPWSVRCKQNNKCAGCPECSDAETTTQAPTEAPTEAQTEAPTMPPTEAPTMSPTEAPTMSPTEAPTTRPTMPPTEAPTMPPTEAPTTPPTMPPTDAPATSRCSQYTSATTCKIATCGWHGGYGSQGPCVACESATTEADCQTISYMSGCIWSRESTCKGAMTIDFGGYASQGHANMNMRPEDTRAEFCNGGSCGECTDVDKCWHGAGYGDMDLNLPANSPGVRKWIVWTQCLSSDGKLMFLVQSLTNGIITVSMNDSPLYTFTTIDHSGWRIKNSLPKDIKIVVSFTPTDVSQASAAKMKLRAINQDEFVDDCLARGFCLNEMAEKTVRQSVDGFALRNSNRGQFDCLQGNTNLLPSGMVSQCAEWKQCLDSQAASSPEGGFEASLVHMFGAAFGDDEADNSVTADESCIDPRIADAEVFECECLNDLKTLCTSHSNQKACYKELFCGHCKICLSWKQEQCSATQVAHHQTSCSATALLENSSARTKSSPQENAGSSAALLQRTKAHQDSAVADSLDASVTGKCA